MKIFLNNRTRRRGATLTNSILIIGMIFISLAIVGVLRNLALQQAKQVEIDYTISVVEDLKSAIEKAASTPANVEYVITLKDPLIYTINISQNRILAHFAINNLTSTTYFFPGNSVVIPSNIENSGIIHIYKKDNYIIITRANAAEECNLEDDKCDAACIALGICDPACKSPMEKSVCNPYCLDTNKNGRIDPADADKICIPACYTNFDKGVYDIDCVDYENDGICDPATNNIKDGICDPDCLGTNGVCDPDCTQYDADCPHKGNGICEPNRGESCLDYPLFQDCKCSDSQICKADCPAIQNFLDERGCIEKTKLSAKGQQCTQDCQCSQDREKLICDTRFGTFRCCPPDSYYKNGACTNYKNDGICNTSEPFSENCQNSPNDCKCTAECCPNCVGAESSGCCPSGTKKCQKQNGLYCITPGGKAEGQRCECDAECNSGLKCMSNPKNSNDKACCPNGKSWDGNTCKNSCSFTMLFIKIDPISNFGNVAKAARDAWVSLSPFKECPDRVCYLFEDTKICPVSETDRRNGNALNIIQQCATSWGYAGKYDRIIGVVAGDCVYNEGESCIGGYTYLNYPALVSSGTRITNVCTHEMGHTFGLCDEGYGGGRCSSCPSGWYTVGGRDCYDNCYVPEGEELYCCPNVPEKDSIMCSMDACRYGCSEGYAFTSTSYTYLRSRIIQQYCG